MTGLKKNAVKENLYTFMFRTEKNNKSFEIDFLELDNLKSIPITLELLVF